MSSPPPPPPPPPSTETDVAFGIVLILMALMLAAFLLFVPRLIRQARGLPPVEAESSTTEKAPPADAADAVDAAFSVRMPMTDLRPLKR